MANSKIEWTNKTWNPVTGCTKISPGCKNCYAERMSRRLHLMGVSKYANNFNVTLHNSNLKDPLQWKRSHLVFVNSMSDLLHDRVPDDFIFRVFSVMREAHYHQFQVLTKRSKRLIELDKELKWTPNIWMGVSVENSDYLFRVEHLRETGAYVKFLSLEPLLGPLHRLNLKNIDWVIVGGESGPKSRPMNKEWVLEIKEKCTNEGVSFFFKQWGGTVKKRTGRILEGRTWDEMPTFV